MSADEGQLCSVKLMEDKLLTPRDHGTFFSRLNAGAMDQAAGGEASDQEGFDRFGSAAQQPERRAVA